jgi:hypothetical protein
VKLTKNILAGKVKEIFFHLRSEEKKKDGKWRKIVCSILHIFGEIYRKLNNSIANILFIIRKHCCSNSVKLNYKPNITTTSGIARKKHSSSRNIMLRMTLIFFPLLTSQIHIQFLYRYLKIPY